jgi:hypothetical protein
VAWPASEQLRQRRRRQRQQEEWERERLTIGAHTYVTKGRSPVACAAATRRRPCVASEKQRSGPRHRAVRAWLKGTQRGGSRPGVRR